MRITTTIVTAFWLFGLYQIVAADTVQYEVVFDATWGPVTHPLNFPPSPHFSGLIGGTHNSDVHFWGPGRIATRGIESMAETGSKTSLVAEFNTAIGAGTANAIISGGGIGRSPGSAQKSFEVDADFPLVSLVSMIAPSPDWFVGVDSWNLLDTAGDHWQRELIVPLMAYDAGTDSGINYTSPNADTSPQEPIVMINSGPFQDAAPLGTFTFRLTTGDFDGSGSHSAVDIDVLSGAIANASTDTRFDLNNDGTVESGDRIYLVERLLGTLVGDANLDSVVDGSDFNLWNDHRNQPATWATGDFNGDLVANEADLGLLTANLFAPAELLNVSVPEPTAIWLDCFAALLLLCVARQRRPTR